MFLARLAEAAPDLAWAGELAPRFAALVRNAPDAGAGPALDAWFAEAKGTALDAFARGIQRDRDAVLAALIEPWSTGPVEGQINRLKPLKRTMYGRAGNDLLRRRVLNAARRGPAGQNHRHHPAAPKARKNPEQGAGLGRKHRLIPSGYALHPRADPSRAGGGRHSFHLSGRPTGGAHSPGAESLFRPSCRAVQA